MQSATTKLLLAQGETLCVMWDEASANGWNREWQMNHKKFSISSVDVNDVYPITWTLQSSYRLSAWIEYGRIWLLFVGCLQFDGIRWEFEDRDVISMSIRQRIWPICSEKPRHIYQKVGPGTKSDDYLAKQRNLNCLLTRMKFKFCEGSFKIGRPTLNFILSSCPIKIQSWNHLQTFPFLTFLLTSPSLFSYSCGYCRLAIRMPNSLTFWLHIHILHQCPAL
jgi:hypothetical protein